LLRAIEHPAIRVAVDAERGFLAGLGGGCSAPVAAFAALADGRGQLRLAGLAAAVDGTRVIRVAGTGARDTAWDLGRRVADDALARGAGEFVS
jgi:hydroxymethylbilane synthase